MNTYKVIFGRFITSLMGSLNELNEIAGQNGTNPWAAIGSPFRVDPTEGSETSWGLMLQGYIRRPMVRCTEIGEAIGPGMRTEFGAADMDEDGF